jgi:hypothetical protein
VIDPVKRLELTKREEFSQGGSEITAIFPKRNI